MDRPNIYTYHDYIKFLNDWLNYLRVSGKGFNLRAFSKQTGVALGYMSMVLKRERTMTEKAFLKITPHLGIPKEEVRFLSLMRILGQTDSSEARLEALEEMMKFKKFREAKPFDSRTFEYLTRWYYVAIYEMCNLDNFEPSAEAIQKRLKQKVSIAEITDAIDFLAQQGFIKKAEDGRWVQVHAHLDCTEGIFKISLAQFHRQMLDLAHLSIYNTKGDDRYIMGQTMAVSPENFQEIKKIISQAIAAINEVNRNSYDKDNIYHIEFAAFPLLEKVGAEK